MRTANKNTQKDWKIRNLSIRVISSQAHLLLIDRIIDIVTLPAIPTTHFKDAVSDSVTLCLGLNGVANIGLPVISERTGN